MGEPVPDRVLNFGSNTPKAATEEKVLTPEDMTESQVDQLPEPTGFRILILPVQAERKTKGGILLSDKTVEREQLATVIGQVLKVGPDAYSDETRFASPWCKEGDYVLFGRYAGARIPIEGGEIRILNDDEILALVSNPEVILNTYQ
jgi:chaperonin GroES